MFPIFRHNAFFKMYVKAKCIKGDQGTSEFQGAIE